MAATPARRVICHSRELVERGRGFRFEVVRRGEAIPAFAIRFNGEAHAYLNRCSHRSIELDWNAGEFFDAFGQLLLCATHGARYAPASGVCMGGPCARTGLVKLPVFEDGGEVCLNAGDEIHLINADKAT